MIERSERLKAKRDLMLEEMKKFKRRKPLTEKKLSLEQMAIKIIN